MRASVRVVASGERSEPVGTRTRLAQLGQTILLLAGLALLIQTAAILRAGALPNVANQPLLAAGAGAADPTGLKTAAALHFEQALAKGGSGVRFEIVQFQTIKARPGGRRIEIPHPVDRNKTIGLTDEYFLSSLEERGIATGAGFWSEMRAGPAPDAPPNWGADLLYQALQTTGKTWRNDGRGWFLTDSPPGIGLDPRTVILVPTLLRDASSPSSAPAEPVGEANLTAITAVGTVSNIPGLVAADGSKFTKLRGRMTFAFDANGRLAEIRASALNTNMDEFDLVVDTTIVIYYGNTGSLPQPAPALADTSRVVEP